VKRKWCKRCGKNPAVINFCNECAREINRAHENVMERTKAAVCYLRGTAPMMTHAGKNASAMKQHRRLEMAAFLSIFHPEIHPDKAAKIAHDIL
jgi:hypothetical protein